MLPVTSRRVDYTDDQYEGSEPPTRTTDVLAVVYSHNDPYRTFDYGHDNYTVDGVEMTGGAISDPDWETYWLNLYTEEHKLRPPYAHVEFVEMRVPEVPYARVVWAEIEAPT